MGSRTKPCWYQMESRARRRAGQVFDGDWWYFTNWLPPTGNFSIFNLGSL